MESNVLLIYANKTRIMLFFFSGFVFLALGLGFWWIGIYFWTFFFVFVGLFNLYMNFGKAFLNDPLLKLDDEGITDNMNIPSYGKIPWNQVVKAEISDLGGFDNIFVHLKDTEAFIKSQSFIKRPIMRSNLKNVGACVMFRCNVFPEQADKVVDLINRLAKGRDVE